MAEIPIGHRHQTSIQVTSDNAISFLGLDDARVLATPWLIAYLEMTARDAVKPYLLESEDTVGTQVNVRHLAAAPIGEVVSFSAEVIGVDGRRVQFKVEAADKHEKLAEGTHERFIIDVARFAERARTKRESRSC
jgi:fluoroacetyl-CoA thioesterase